MPASLTAVMLAMVKGLPLVTVIGMSGKAHRSVKHCVASKKLELYKGTLQTSQLIVRLIFGSATKASSEGVTKEPGEHVGRSHNVKMLGPYWGRELFLAVIAMNSGTCDGSQSETCKKKGET